MKIGHLFTPRMRPQAIDVPAAVTWGVAAGTTALWLFQQWEGLIELLGSESRTARGLEFLHKLSNFKVISGRTSRPSLFKQAL